MTQFEQIKGYLPLLRKRKGLTQQAMADRLDIGLRQYQRIEQTGRSSFHTLEKIAGLLGTTLSDMLAASKSASGTIEERKNALNKIGTRIAHEVEFEANIDMAMQREVFRIPVVSEIPASGFQKSFEDMIAEEYTYTTIKKPGTFALRVKGDSMAKLIENGDLVVLTPDVFFENGKVYAIIAGDSEATLKRVFREKGMLRLVPENKKFKEMQIAIEDVIRLYRVARIEKAP